MIHIKSYLVIYDMTIIELTSYIKIVLGKTKIMISSEVVFNRLILVGSNMMLSDN